MHCVYDLVLNYLLISATAITLSSCSVNISQVHTDGEATDIIDTTQTTDPKTDANLSIPTGAL